MQELIKNFETKYLNAGMGLIDAFIVFIIGWYAIKLVLRILDKVVHKSHIDPMIINFIKSVLNVTLKIILFITTLSTMGVSTTSLVAVLTTAGAAVALGLQDAIKGLFSGLTILLAKPFEKGDIIEVNNYIGKIQEIQFLYTILMTFDNKMVVIPNNELASSTFVNYSHEDMRRVDMQIDIHYDNDIELAKQVIMKVIEQHPYALKEPLPYVRVSEYKDSSIAISIRVWTKTEHYYELKDDLTEQIKIVFDQEGIIIPYSQLDIHVHQKEENHH